MNEFSRAPGSSSVKPPSTPGGLVQSHSSPNMNPLLGQTDSAWSSRLGESGWPDAGNNDAADGKDWQSGAVVGGAAFTDLVPEFEPGKPWKVIFILIYFHVMLWKTQIACIHQSLKTFQKIILN